jgi:hypothetical protein
MQIHGMEDAPLPKKGHGRPQEQLLLSCSTQDGWGAGPGYRNAALKRKYTFR